MTDLQHLQNVLLMIIKDVDQLCKENGISYFLAWGSALGAIRHKGFIPWDDDLDIEMDIENYQKFLSIAKEKLDKKKYFLQEGYVNWPMPYSKLRLKGTLFVEEKGFDDSDEHKGIFIDIFPLEHVPSSRIKQVWMYFCGRLLNAYCLSVRGFQTNDWRKKIAIKISKPLKHRSIYNYFRNQLEKYRGKETPYMGSFHSNERLNNFVFRTELCKNLVYVPFEDTMLPVPAGYDEMLRILFGDYMTPPPENMRQVLHMNKIEFGNY